MMKNRNIKYILNNIKSFPAEIILSVFSGITATILALIFSKLIGETIDLTIQAGAVNFNAILKNLLIMALITVSGSILRFTSSFYAICLSYKTENLIRMDLFKKINRVPLSYIDSTPHGDIISCLINDSEAIGEGIYQIIIELFPGTAVIIGSLILIKNVDITIMWLVISLTPLIFLTSWSIAKFSYRNFREYTYAQGKLMGFSEESISNQYIINAFGCHKKFINKFKEVNKTMYQTGFKSQFFSSLANPSLRLVSWLIYGTAGTMGIYLSITKGDITIGGVSSILIYISQYTRPFNDIMGVITQIQSAFASLTRYTEFIYNIPNQRESSGSLNIEKCDGNISIKNLFFSYNSKTPIIKNFNLEIKSGSKVALVGVTGCGKSTIINLLMGFYEPNSGTISIDGIPIKQADLKNLRSIYGMILQDTWLYTSTIKNNIAYGNPHASTEEIIHAAKLSNAHKFIKKLDKGYDTILSKNGNNISQGQKQLISIARVMLTNPKILLLDEATSNIDTRTEIKVQDAFNKLMQGRTSIIVAHRLSTIENADMIVVINNKEIEEKGTHHELLLKRGFYYDLYNSQFNI